MIEVKEIFERMLETPAPPRRGGAEVLAVARRAARRRSARTALGSGVAVAASIVAAFVVIPVSRWPAPLPQIAGATPTGAPSVPMPRLRDVNTHGAQIADRLTRAIPAALTPGPVESAPVWAFAPSSGGYVTSVRQSMSAGRGQGELEVDFRIGAASASTGAVCSAAAVTQVAAIVADAGVECQTFTIAGNQIQVTGVDGLYRVITATRFLSGGFVTVVSRQGSLATPPLGPADVAAIAADPAILP